MAYTPLGSMLNLLFLLKLQLQLFSAGDLMFDYTSSSSESSSEKRLTHQFSLELSDYQLRRLAKLSLDRL